MITVAALGFLGEPIPGQGFWLSWLDGEDAKLVWARRAILEGSVLAVLIRHGADAWSRCA